MYASQFGHEESVRALIEKGASLEAVETVRHGQTALLWASKGGHAETVRVLVELGASLEAVDKVHIHAHALAYTCCIRHVSGIMRMTMIFFPPSPKSDHLIFPFPKQFY
jgi:hypothetical protein